MDSNPSIRYGYKKIKNKGGYEETVANLLPHDEVIEMLTFDLDLLIEAVYERRAAGRGYYLSPDEIAAISNSNWQMQCRIAEHIVDFALDYDKVSQSGS